MKQVVLVIFLLQTFSGFMYAQKNCDAVLLTETKHIIQSNISKSLSWLKLVDSDSYEQNKREIKANYDIVSANYGEFNSKRNKYLKQQQYNLDSKHARLEVMEVKGTSNAIQAWRDCVLDGRNLYSIVHKVSKHEVTIEVGWLPSREKGKLKNIVVSTRYPSDIESSGINQINSLDGKRRFVIKRSTSRDIHIAIGGESGERLISYTTSIEIPQYIEPAVVKEFELSDNSMNKLERLLSMNVIKDRGHFSYWKPSETCRVRAKESLYPGEIRINPSLTKLKYFFRCQRYNATSNCGTPTWDNGFEDHYNSSATADLEYKDDVLYIKNIQFNEQGKDSNCGDNIRNHLASINGTPIKLEFTPKIQ